LIVIIMMDHREGHFLGLVDLAASRDINDRTFAARCPSGRQDNWSAASARERDAGR